MNARQLEAFRAVIEDGTVSGAARRLSISQPAVSKLVAALERGTGLLLFHIHGRRTYSPTCFDTTKDSEILTWGNRAAGQAEQAR